MAESKIVTQAPPPAGVGPMLPPGSVGSFAMMSFMVRAILTISARVLISAVKRMFGGKTPTTAVQEQPIFHLSASMGITALGRFSPGPRETYLAWCKKHKKEPQVTPLEENTAALWCYGEEKPPSPDHKLFLYFHGGGFSFGGASEEMIQYMFALKDEAKKAGVESSGVILQYSLATEGTGNPYPRQLTQAVVILNHLIYTLVWKPSQIIIIGESAGSNLMFATLLHAIRPCPHVPHQLKLSEPLFMVIALAPFVMLNYKSTTEPKHNTDYMGHSDYNKFVVGFLPPRDNIDVRWGNFEDTPKEWWTGLGKACKRILITAGTEELLYSDIVRFSERILEAKKDDLEGTEYVLDLKTEFGVHSEPSVRMGVPLDDIPQWKMVQAWFNERINQ